MRKLLKNAVSLLLAAALIVPQGSLLALNVNSELESSFYKDLLNAIWKQNQVDSLQAELGSVATNLTWSISDAGVLTVKGNGAMPDWSWTENAPWYASKDDITSVVVEAGITKIGDRAFYNCKNLVSATISDTVVTIGNRAFWWCESLTNVHLGSKVATIGYNAFDTCKNLTTINIPNSVTVVGHNAFSGCTKLPNLNLPETVKYVGGVSFYECDTVTTASIPYDTTAIKGMAYYGCDNLTSVSIPEGVTSIGYSAFKYCPGLTSVTVPENVSDIGSYAFGYCDSLSSVTVYSRDAEFGTNVFEGAASTLTIKAYIGSTAHAYAINNGYNFVPLTGTGAVSAIGECGDGLTWTLTDLGDLMITGAGDMDEWAAASGAPWHAFRPYIKTVTVDAGISSISNYAFTDFSALTTITVKSRIAVFGSNTIGGSAAKPTVYGYAGTTSETFAASNGYTFVALEERPILASGECGTTLTWILYTDGNLEISGVGEMFNYTSSSPAGWSDYSDDIKSVTFGYGVTSVGNYAFRRCTAIESLEFSKTVTTIGEKAFSECTGLTELILTEGIVKIGKGAFGYCDKLTSISIPASVTEIGSSAFTSCTSLTGFTVAAESENYASDANGVLFDKNMTQLIRYPMATAKTAYTVPSTVTSIASSAFDGAVNLKIVNIGNGVLNIGDSAFALCSNLERVTIDTRNTAFGFGVFMDVASGFTLYGYDNSTADKYAAENSIKFVAFSERTVVASGNCGATVTWALYEDGELDIKGTGAMYTWTSSTSNSAPWYSNRTKITSVTVNSGVTTIGNYAFNGCSSLTDIYIGDDVTTIGNYVFRRCTALADVEIPETVTSLGASAFNGCSGLKNISIPASVGAIASSTFNGCSGLTNVVIQNGITSISSYAFAYCENLQIINIPASVSNIDNGAFSGCTNLKGFAVDPNNEYYLNDDNGILLTKDQKTLLQYPLGLDQGTYQIPATVQIIVPSAFEGAANLKTVEIGENVSEIGDLAFYTCSSLKKVVILARNTTFGMFVFDGVASGFEIHGYLDSSAKTYANSNSHKFVEFVPRNIIAEGDCGENVTWTLYDDGVLEISGEGDMYNWTTSNPAPWSSYSAQIQSVAVGYGVTNIGDYAFRRCSALTSFSTEGSVTVIGKSAFNECTSLAAINIPNGVTTISANAFSRCTAVTEINIPASVKSIKTTSFMYCSSVERFNVDAGNTSYANDEYGVLFDKVMATLICFPVNCKVTEYVIPLSVFVISGSAFEGAANLETVKISADVSIIGDCAFLGAAKLKEAVVLAKSVDFGLFVFGELSEDFEIHSYTGSSAEAYAKENSIKFVSLDAPVSYVAKVGETSYTTLAEALAATGNVTLLANIEDAVVVSKVVTINKNGFTANLVAGSGYEVIEKEDTYNVYTAVKKFDLAGTTMTLGSSLSLDFAIDITKVSGKGNYAVLAIEYADGRDAKTITVPQSEWVQYRGNIYTAKFVGMAAKEMNDVVTAIFYNANGQQITNSKSDSIVTYSMRAIPSYEGKSDEESVKYRTMYVDMINYGAAAQEEFTYDVENPANKVLSATHKTWASELPEIADSSVKGTGCAGSTLGLEGEIQLNFVFNNSTIGKDYSKLYATVTYTDHYGKEKELYIEGTDFNEYGDTMCRVTVVGMAVADYESLVTCEVYNSNGVKLSYAIDSVESYASRALKSGKAGPTIDKIVKFAASAYEYFHLNDK